MPLRLEPQYIFGIRGGVNGGVAHVSPDTILYPAGAFLVLHNTATGKQEFISVAEEGMLTALAMSPTRQLCGVCRAGDIAAVSVWDLRQRKRARFLTCAEMVSDRYVAAAFSPDEKLVAAQGGAPDWTLVLFVLEKGKVFSVLRLSDTPGLGPVSSVAFHPEDPGVLSVVGERVLKLLRLNAKLLKSWGYQGGNNHNCVCQAWADQHTLLVGTDTGTLLILEEGEFRIELTVTHPDLPISSSDKESGASKAEECGTAAPLGPKHRRITVLSCFSGGFVCACGPDQVFIFQRSDNINDYYVQVGCCPIDYMESFMIKVQE
ncbi:cilia- and flagella-associated protein 57-like [Oratosquilla oratoria]|uniref:cilia- and flagella-associated protein 57-like n=1 Tax=Oratosquilla oratoria TaxID=337810 RepID=UPI003F76706E